MDVFATRFWDWMATLGPGWSFVMAIVVMWFVSITITTFFKSLFGMVRIKVNKKVERQEDDRKEGKTVWERLRGGGDG